jgi:hypothetical protein
VRDILIVYCTGVFNTAFTYSVVRNGEAEKRWGETALIGVFWPILYAVVVFGYIAERNNKGE